jgi:hemoglobin
MRRADPTRAAGPARPQMRSHSTQPSIFERYGGFATVRRIVSTFYDSVLDSPVLAPHFEHVDVHRLIDHQAKFISSVMGGPASYTDEHLARVHARLGITTAEFRTAVDLLIDALEEHDVATSDIDQIVAEIRRREGVVVTSA